MRSSAPARDAFRGPATHAPIAARTSRTISSSSRNPPPKSFFRKPAGTFPGTVVFPSMTTSNCPEAPTFVVGFTDSSRSIRAARLAALFSYPQALQ
jgi:hypothetical protein